MSPSVASHHHFPTVITAVECEPLPELARPIRDFVTRTARRLAVSDETAETARLLVGELVANAVVHSRTSALIRVEVLHDPDCGHLIVSVEDRGSAVPKMPTDMHTAPDDESGRGLAFVQSLSAECGVAACVGGGKRVWFALSLN
ncbi:ATP-binding protein [Yinghuangia sp. YIM S09857]|uniref:ATP-binding protein n=1 Tax=Yinghuangia sp. YIM S09857 TaxID=3436929 RepID=UPI003F5383A0